MSGITFFSVVKIKAKWDGVPSASGGPVNATSPCVRNIYSFVPPCKELDRLLDLYIQAVNAHHEAVLATPSGEVLKEATKETREACVAALAALDEHRKEHGC